ncbi:putative inosine-uridine preferring nucleoside hydrolase protein [Phaeoacremonium minimum UCRPA7]|uniref:Putative inosine-uridine preferring nucleoside hydrolase protein n=1 Tax=Phaeoacremonium minimum (strain UCR-PA7) TaxID=1286976 RepID=R8BRT7_PHAM7|nr:putative inosine-uridine preferring nucleoside hydrolase protein [Phaeoacremonium minimum UCRPA7]EOO02056.1 putative inosine-uridine preferring nucleoside hydrolase protein [Phaeoacremonium minimum UCRPA7]
MMAPKNRIIIDTDPGVDDTLAILLALAAHPDDLEVVMLSVTYGNVPLQSCLRNVVALFHVLEKETAWRKTQGKPEGFSSLKTFKPIVAVGAEHPLEDDELMADNFHGADGLHGHPDLTPADTWRSLFVDATTGPTESVEPPSFSSFFTPSKTVAHKEILRILKENPEDTISICAVGPLTNLALAASEDPETFLRVKEVVVMGGAVEVPGNITPLAEFNTYADTVATARVFALTSPTPSSTMPPVPPNKATLPPYPAKLSKTLKLSLFPLDLTSPHNLNKNFFSGVVQPLIDEGSPLAKWIGTFMFGTYNKIESILQDGKEPGMSLHDPLTIWYMITRDDPLWKAVPELEDIRVETSGQWTRGMHIIDRRERARPPKHIGPITTHPDDPLDAVEFNEDASNDWSTPTRGNRINRIIGSPGEDIFAKYLMERIVG